MLFYKQRQMKFLTHHPFNIRITKRLTHQRKVSGNGGRNFECQCHDRKGHCSTTFRGRSGHHRAKNHGEGHDVFLREDVSIIIKVPDNMQKPDGTGKEDEEKIDSFFHKMFDCM